MIKQKLEAMMAMIMSRSAQLVWASFFVAGGVVGGLFGLDPVTAAIGWGMAGFMACHLINTLMWQHSVRKFRRETIAHAEHVQTGLQHAIEMLKADLDRFAAERGYEVDIETGWGDPTKPPSLQ
jgi:hypothetical protein